MANMMFTIVAKSVDWLSSLAAQVWTTLLSDIFTAYHPEQHYMRGPGPKWREKHGACGVASPGPIQ
jgi:hypothetical protein